MHNNLCSMRSPEPDLSNTGMEAWMRELSGVDDATSMGTRAAHIVAGDTVLKECAKANFMNKSLSISTHWSGIDCAL